MYFSKKLIVVVLILSILSYFFPKVVFAGQSRMYAKSTNTTSVTEHKPEFQASPERDKPEESHVIGVDRKYVIAGIGLIVIGAIVAAGVAAVFLL